MAQLIEGLTKNQAVMSFVASLKAPVGDRYLIAKLRMKSNKARQMIICYILFALP